MYHGSNTWEMKCCMAKFQRSWLLLLPKEWDSVDTAGVASMNLPINYYNENQHMTKELGGDQDEHSVINWLMTLNYKKMDDREYWKSKVVDVWLRSIRWWWWWLWWWWCWWWWKLMKNAFYFILKALFLLKIFKVLSRHFGHVGKTPWLER